MNRSPWIAQLNRTRPVEPLDQNLETDVIIVGGGIAGITTAYYLLTKTSKHIVLLEANKVAHGATGHNAGQVSSYYEKSFKEMIEQFGVEQGVSAQRIIEEDARILFGNIFIDAQLTTPHSDFIGYEACVTREHVETYLADLILRERSGLKIRPMIVAKEWISDNPFDSQYDPYIRVVDHKDLLALLETTNPIYIAANTFLSGCTNSALFTEELVGFLLTRYSDRFSLREHTPVARVVLETSEVLVEAGINTVSAESVVLCTNGFESITIINNAGDPIDGVFHHEVEGLIGYMAGYTEGRDKHPFAASYANPNQPVNQLYYYTTRRPYEIEKVTSQNLICIGGPETHIPDRGAYDAKKEYPLEVVDAIETFAAQTYTRHKGMEFYWHGLMGYTKSGVRLIGAEPRNQRLLYNLGCNGVGILTSVYGGNRIAQIIDGQKLEPSIFDPQ